MLGCLKRAGARPAPLLLSISMLLALPLPAQVPDEFTNLQVLPKDIAKGRLIGIMREFAGALGVRCDFCHVGENVDTLEGFNFAADDREHKQAARVMMKMVSQINNSFIPQLGHESPIRVRCVTCHGGLAKPQTMQEVMLAEIEAEGVDAAVAKYRQLRAEHYGDGAYDFSDRALNSVTETLVGEQMDLEAAMTVIDLNLEYHPDSAFAHYLRSQILLRQGDREGAIRGLERAIELEPGAAWLEQQLERIKSAPADP